MADNSVDRMAIVDGVRGHELNGKLSRIIIATEIAHEISERNGYNDVFRGIRRDLKELLEEYTELFGIVAPPAPGKL